MPAPIVDFLSGSTWSVAQDLVAHCNWHLTAYAALGCSLLMRADAARLEHRPDEARAHVLDGLLHVWLALLVAGH